MRENKQKTTDEDSEFVSLCKKGDTDAFEILVKKHQKRMLNIAYRMTGNYEEACDIVQDAFVSAYKSIKSFRGKAKFSTWLCTIVMNLSKNRLKQLKTQLHHEKFSMDNPILTNNGQIRGELASSGPSALESLEKKDVHEKVQECINSLDEEFREVLILRDIQGFSYDEINNLLEVPEGTVKSRLFRAREALKDCLKNVIGDL
ncbi:MAG: sigma-70 family RNA polymerase sigma factor [Deltaproteobacteria bacterium]|nr:MAG: sigma-70 family RNA polymerase sigma factor [Deltaproteobacteria bacterium]